MLQFGHQALKSDAQQGGTLVAGPLVLRLLREWLASECSRESPFSLRWNMLTEFYQVGGLVAYGLALEKVDFHPNSNTPRNVRTWLLNYARGPREQGGLNVIWNEVHGY